MSYTQQMSRDDQRRVQALDYAIMWHRELQDFEGVLDTADEFLRFLQNRQSINAEDER